MNFGRGPDIAAWRTGGEPLCPASLIRRFQIEELVTQDAWGVVFRAVDGETGEEVALRRFFPFGMEGGGLQEEERTAYAVAVARLRGVAHPALRSVVGGGCDPVDGMPFIATQWVKGELLSERLGQGALSPPEAIYLLEQVLEVSGVLSEVLAEEACWVETELGTVVIGEEGSGRDFTFWISPLKWLGADESQRSLEPLIGLAEAAMGWQGRVVGDGAGGGLGGWIKWLRGNVRTCTIHEAREMLAVATGRKAPEPAQVIVQQVVSPPAPVVMRPMVHPVRIPAQGSRKPVVLMVLVAVVVISAVGWFLTRTKPVDPLAAVPKDPTATAVATTAGGADVPLAGQRSGDAASARAEELARGLSEGQDAAAAALEQRKAEVMKRGGFYQVEDSDLLLQKAGEEVVVQGTLARIRSSDSGKTLYFEFSEEPAGGDVRGYFMTESAPEGLDAETFKGLVGKKVRMNGLVHVETAGGVRRPQLLIEETRSIVAVP